MGRIGESAGLRRLKTSVKDRSAGIPVGGLCGPGWTLPFLSCFDPSFPERDILAGILSNG